MRKDALSQFHLYGVSDVSSLIKAHSLFQELEAVLWSLREAEVCEDRMEIGADSSRARLQVWIRLSQAASWHMVL